MMRTITDRRAGEAGFTLIEAIVALALMSLVLGLNLLADGLREESLRD